ncbi:hypothetical protein FQN55_001967 [Onygenales sp. PD_40]|nr:hypothetical protein FQN55_001967 [Onygenales sp. PD_40]
MPTSATCSCHSNGPKTCKTHPCKSAKATLNVAAAAKGTLQNAAATKAVNRPAKRKPALRKRKAALQAVPTTPTLLQIRFPNPAAIITVNMDNEVDEEDKEDEEDEDEAPPPYMESSPLPEDQSPKESGSKSFKVELVMYFRGEIIDAEAVAAAMAAAEAETVQLTKLTSKKHTKDVKNDLESPTWLAKSPCVADAADDENTAENTVEKSACVTSTTKQHAELKTKCDKEDELSQLSRELEK